MLEVLTETEETNEGRKRIASILEEQRMTLQYAMSRPQVCVLCIKSSHSKTKSLTTDTACFVRNTFRTQSRERRYGSKRYQRSEQNCQNSTRFTARKT